MKRIRWTRLLPVVLVAAVAVGLLQCSPLYVLRAGVEEARILARRQPIEGVIAAPGTSDEVRRKLRLVLDARQFAAHGLGLDVAESYTTYSPLDRDTLALVVSAAEKHRFELHTWWFPIVGRVPYKGFFSLDAARAEAERLEARGLDTYIRPTGAFSTLGWFNDPLLTTVLRRDDVGLVSTVIHELTHNTLYLPGRAAFNESFANFVGDRGAAEFFCALDGETGERCRSARAAWRDNLRFGAFLQQLVEELEALYARAELTREQKIEAREDVYADARRRFAEEVAPALETAAFRGFERARLNNAVLIAWRLYYDRLDVFDRALHALGGELPAAVDAIAAAARAAPDAPYDAVARLAGD